MKSEMKNKIINILLILLPFILLLPFTWLDFNIRKVGVVGILTVVNRIAAVIGAVIIILGVILKDKKLSLGLMLLGNTVFVINMFVSIFKNAKFTHIKWPVYIFIILELLVTFALLGKDKVVNIKKDKNIKSDK